MRSLCNMASSVGTKPYHILVIIAHLPMKEWCIGHCGVHSPSSNMCGMFYSPVFVMLALECYFVKFR